MKVFHNAELYFKDIKTNKILEKNKIVSYIERPETPNIRDT